MYKNTWKTSSGVLIVTVCGIKQKRNDKDIFLSIEERRVYDGQVGTIIAVNSDGKCIANLIDVFEDGSIRFIPGNDASKLGLKLDDEGKLFAYDYRDNIKSERLFASDKPIAKVTKLRVESVMKFKHYPIVRVVESSCVGVKAGCRSPLTIALVYNSGSCPPTTSVVIKDYFTGSQLSSIVGIYADGKVDVFPGVSSGYGLDLSESGSVKIRGKLPTKL